MKRDTKSIPILARWAGVFYLIIILAGIFGQVLVRGSLVVPGDAPATAAAIADSASLWRWGVWGDLVMHLCDVPVMVLLFILLRPVSPGLAMTALGFNLVQTAVLVANKLALLIPLLVLKTPVGGDGFTASQVHQLVALWIEVHNLGFALGLVFFGAACLLYGLLLYRSKYFPRTIGVLVGVAGLCYLINSFTLILAPELSGAVTPVLVFSLLGEASFTLWLLFKGVNLPEFQKAESLWLGRSA